MGQRASSPAMCLLKPIAAVGDPPAGKDDWDGSAERPPERKDDVRHYAKHGEYDPEDFAFHAIILCREAAEVSFRK